MKDLLKGSLGTLALAPLLFLAGAQEPVGDGDLKVEVERQAAQLELVQGELADLRNLMDANAVYLSEQSKAARSFVTILSTSEKQGFTAGINPTSRETLLGGFRAYLASQQAGIPGAKLAALVEE
jgi:negative regulator of replication initiation